MTYIKVLIGITFSYLGVTTVLETQDDFRLVLPYVEFAKQLRGTRPMLLDTSALIDGRIADVAGTGFLQAPVVVPRFVIAELQTLSDSAEPMKRAKGRRWSWRSSRSCNASRSWMFRSMRRRFRVRPWIRCW